MELLKERMNSMSDGVMAILITIMVFNIPIPSEFYGDSIISLLINIGIFFISFLIIGTQWVKHCQLMKVCQLTSERVLWVNILYLACLSLMPLFTKWIMTNPTQVVAVVGYDLVFFMVTFCYHLLQKAVFDANSRTPFVQRLKDIRFHKADHLLFGISALVILVIFGLSFIYPTVSVIFFVGIPIIPSIHNIIDEDHEERQINRLKKQKKLSLNG